jgi:hypothetical protein
MFQERCRMRVTVNRLSREANGRKRVGTEAFFLIFCCTSQGNSQVSRIHGNKLRKDPGFREFSFVVFEWVPAGHCIGTLHEG